VRKGKPDPRGKEKPCWSEKKDTKTETDVYLFRRIAEKGKQTTGSHQLWVKLHGNA